MKEIFVLGVTHVDLAWKRGPQEMNEMLEIVVVRLLDALEQHPALKYVIEQCAHFRNLAKRRPDLVERLRPYLHSGRVEMVGAMASTLETNLPNGECLVRNQAIGLKYARDTWGIEPETAWLIDTFGLNAQLPQIFRQFGFRHLVANRFGGDKYHDLFRARGLDGSEITIVGQDVYSPFVRPVNHVNVCYRNWDGLDRLFKEGDALTGPGPLCLIAITENELLVSTRQLDLIEARSDRSDQKWLSATPRDFFAALDQTLDQTGRDLPVLDGDLNPEFTGCFSLRSPIRLRNRAAENLLLEAEKWSALLNLSGGAQAIEEAWWQLAFVHFHDVFTGSHPTSVYQDVMKALDEVEDTANGLLRDAFAAGQEEKQSKTQHFVVANGLPWERHGIVKFPIAPGSGASRVLDENDDGVPFRIAGEEIHCLATLPSLGIASFKIEAGLRSETSIPIKNSASIENEFIRLDCDTVLGIRRLVWKPTGATLLEDAGDLLVVQQDSGNFQIESPSGTEVAAAAGTFELKCFPPSPVGQTLVLSGTFPPLSWAGEGNELRFEAEFTLVPGRTELALKLQLFWKGEASRVRLKLATPLSTSEGIYEVPFGTVARRPYGQRGTARGEWPAHRFVTLEDGKHGLALVNTGVGGVEVSGGTLLTTLLRAPRSEYAGMVPDESSSQHGHHEYRFSLVPYAGSWSETGLLERAQELNNPPAVFAVSQAQPVLVSRSWGTLEGPDRNRVVLSCLKAAEDASGDLIVRLYETTGQTANVVLVMEKIESGWLSDLRETKGQPLVWDGRGTTLALAPFEIVTVRLVRTT